MAGRNISKYLNLSKSKIDKERRSLLVIKENKNSNTLRFDYQ